MAISRIGGKALKSDLARDSNLTFNTDTLVVDYTNGRIGIGVTSPTNTLSVTGSANVDNIKIDGNAITSTNTNGNITISPDGNGSIDVDTSQIVNVTDPTGAQHAATKAYVDSQVSSSAVAISNIDIDGGTDIGAALVDADLFIVDDGASGTNRKSTLSRLKTYIGVGATAADDIAAGDGAVNITTTTGNITIDAQANDSDIIFKGTDGSADTTFLTIDGSAAGEAIFNAGIVIADAGTIGSASDKNAITIAADGVVTMDQIPVFSAGINVSGGTIAGTLATAAQTNITSLGTLTALQVDNLNINGNTISSTAGTDLNITPLAGQQIVLDGTIVVDAGVVTGATSITSTAFVGNITGDVTGNADTATALETARTIGGVSFDGTGNINLPGVNTSGTQDTSGNAATATALETARNIHGVSFDGTGNIDLSEVIQDTVGAMFGSNTETGITVTYQDGDGTIDLVVGTLNQDTTGNAATATALETARTIGGVSFDGTGNINLPGVNTSGNQDTSGTAAIATTVTITDNESTDENNAIIFTAGGAQTGGNLGLESDGTLTYNPSTGVVTATGFAGALTGNVTGNVSGTAATVTGAAQSAITSLGTLTTLTVDNIIINGTTIGHTSDTDSISIASNGVVTLSQRSIHSGGITIADGGNIGSVSDTDAIEIAATGDVTFSQAVTITGNLTINGTTTSVSSTNTKVSDTLLELNTGATSNANDMGIIMERGSTGNNAIIAWDESADKFVVGTTTATADATGNISITTGTLLANVEGSGAGLSAGTTPLTTIDIDGGTDIGAGLADADLFIVDDGAGGTNRKTAASRIKTYIADVTLTTGAQTNITSVGALDGGSITSNFGTINTGSSAITTTGAVSGGSFVVADAGNIGSASDTDAIAIAANGVVTFSQAPVFPDGSINIADIDLDGGTDIGAAIADADLFLIDDGAGGTMRKTAASRLKTYIGAGAADDITAGDAAVTITTTTGNITIDAAADDSDIILKGTDGGVDTTFLTIDGSAAGEATFNAGIVIADAGNIGSASDKDAIAIASNGVVTFSQAPVFPDGSIAVADLDIDGATDIGEALVDADLIIVDNGAGGTNRKSTLARLKTYIGSSVAADDIAAGDAAINLTTTTGNITIDAQGNDTDIILKGTDGSSDTTFLTIDGSAAGKATFNNEIVSGAVITSGAGLIIADAGNIGSASDTDAIAISSSGVVTMNQIPVFSAGINVSGGTIAGTLATAAQTNITSLGTLTALTVDDIAVNGKVITMTGSTDDTAVFTVGTNGTLTIETTDTAAAAANIQITADGTFEVDATTITLDSAGDIVLDADGADVIFKDAGTEIGRFTNSSTDFVMQVATQDKDIVFKGDDGGSGITALTLDMSDAGKATFNGAITGGGLLTTGGNIVIPDAGNIGSASDTDAIAIASNGVVTFSQAPVFPDGSIAVADLDIDGATDIGANLADADLFIVDDGAGGTNRKTAASRIKTYVADVTLTTAAQTNITSVGTLTALTVDNININANSITSTNTDGNITISPNGDGTVDVDTSQIVNVSDPTGAQHAATKAYVDSVVSSGSIGLTSLDIDGGTDIGADLADADLFIVDDGAGGTNRKTAASRIKTYVADVTLTTAAQTNITSLGTLTALTVDDVAINGKVMTMTGSTDDTAVFTVGTNGTLSIVTTDTAAAAANIQITADGTAELAGTTVTLDSGGDIVLDADGADVIFKDAGTSILTITNNSTDVDITVATQDKDINFKGDDGGSGITALTLDMSDAGTAVFNHDIRIADGGLIGSASDADAMQIASTGDITISQDLTVTGNLTINGTTVTTSTDNQTISDSLMELNSGASSNSNDLGIVMERGSTGDNAIIAWDESADKFIVGTTTATGASTGNLSITTGTLVANLEGDVTGNVSGTAATVTGAAQSAITSLGTLTTLTVDNIIINGTNIGHTSDTDSIAIASNGVVTFSQAPVFPDGSIAVADLDIDGGTDIGADLADADLLIVDDGAGGTNRKTAMSRVKTYVADVTLTTAAQTNITSLGTLTALTVDDVAINGKVMTMTGSTDDTAVFTVGTNGTLTIETTDTAAAAANIQITADGTFEVDATTVTLDSAGDIVLDADGADVIFKDAGTAIGTFTNSSSDFVIQSNVQDKDILFKGDDGGSGITALTLDMSDAGKATFNGAITGGGLLTTGGNIVIPDAGNIGSASDTDAIAIASDGVVTMNQIPVFSAGINVSGGTIAGTLATAAQGNITSLGTLTTLTVDNIIINGTNIGHTSDTDAIAIASNGVVTFSQAPVFPDGSIAVADLDIDGATDIGADLADADLFIVDDGAGGTNRKATLSRLKTYIGDHTSAAADDITAGDAAILLTTSSGNITIDAAANDSDIILKGTDGGADTTFLTIDGSAAGKATFNNEIVSGAVITSGAGLIIADDGNIGSASDTDAIAIAADGVVTMNQIPVFSAGINVSGGTIAGTLATAAQTNITSVGTLTALTVDDVAINGKVITMTGSTDDTAVFTVGTNGTLSIVTTDTAAAAANIQITADGTAELAGTTVTLDSGGDIVLDADGADVIFKDAGTEIGRFTNSSTDFVMQVATQDKDIVFKGDDGGSGITALTLDMSDAGKATFNGAITGGGLLTTGGNIVIPDAGNIGSASDTDAIAIASDGVVTMNQIPVFSAGINVSGGTIAGTLATAAQGNITSLGTLTTLTVDNIIINGTNIGHTSDTDSIAIASNGVVTFSQTPVFSSDITVTDDIYLDSDGSVIHFGDDGEVTLTHVHNQGLRMEDSDKLTFGAGDDLQLYHDGSNSYIDDGGDGSIFIRSGTTYIQNAAGSKTSIATNAGAGQDIYHNNTVKLTTTANGITVSGGIIIADAGNIGSASDTDAIAIASDGVVTFSQAPVFPDGSIAVADLDIDGATDIGAAIADADLIIVDDGAGGTNRKATMSRLKTYMGLSAGALALTSLDIDGGTDIGANLADADLFIVDDGAGGTNRKTAASRIKTYVADVTLTTAAQTNITSLGTLTALTVDDVAVNGKVITMTGSTDDTAVFTVGTNGTLTIETTDTAAAAANIQITADGTFEVDATTVTLDSAGDIVLDADGADVIFKDAGTEIGRVTNSSTDLVLEVATQDKDILFKGDDGGSGITALTLDMSDAGTAVFNHDIRIADGGLIGSASDADAMSISSAGLVTFTQDISVNSRNDVRFYDSDNSNYVSLRAGATVSSNVTWTLPTADGTSGQFLKTDGAGNLSFGAAGSGGGSTGFSNSTITTAPGASDNYDLAEGTGQDGDETPFEAGGQDAFGVSLGTVYDNMEPTGSTTTIDYGDGEAYVGA